MEGPTEAVTPPSGDVAADVRNRPTFLEPDDGDEAFTPRGQRTRARLLASARELLEEGGYGHATVTQITERSGVSLGTFYRYFDNKEDLFLVLLRSLVETLYRSVGGTWRADDVRGSLHEATRRYLAAYYENRRLISALRDMASHDADAAAVWWELRSHTNQRMDRHAPRSDPKAEVRTPSLEIGALAGMVEQFAYYWYVEAERYGHEAPTIDDGARVLSRIWYQAVYA